MSQPTWEDFNALKEEVRKIKEQQQTEPMKITRIEIEQKDINIALDNHTEMLRELDQKSDLHTQAFQRVEVILNGHTKSLNVLLTDVETIKGDVSTLKQDVNVLKSDVSTLKQDVSVLKSDVSTLKSDVSTLKSDVSMIKGDTAALNSRVNQVEQKMDEGFQTMEKRFEAISEVQKLILERLPVKKGMKYA